MAFKWGPTLVAGTSGGVVTWSLALTAGQFYSFDAAIGFDQYQQMIRNAFAQWEAVADLDFVEAADSPAVGIRFGWDTIDGVGGAVAEAQVHYSMIGTTLLSASAEIRFDSAEFWYPQQASAAQQFYAVALHEIGHAIGLGHSNNPDSIMYPVALANALSAEDIALAQQLYGPSDGLGPWKAPDIEVVAATYQFFTGAVPGEAGFLYLIESPSNASDLNDAYYAVFNQENRFINFANNLGAFGVGAAAFDAAYGGLNFNQAVAKAYDEIVGIAAAEAAGIDVAAALAFFQGSIGFYTAVALERVTPSGVPLDEATKLVMIGSVLNESLKADVGLYAGAVNDFVSDYMSDGEAFFGLSLFA